MQNLKFVDNGEGFPLVLFHSIPDKQLRCKICKKVPNAPVSCPTTHMCCLKCVENSEKHDCPACGCVFTEENMHVNLAAQFALNEHTIHCSSLPIGDNYCGWSGKIRDLETHLHSTCEYQLVECPFDGCGFKVAKRDLIDHIHLACFKRPTTCRFCGTHFPYDNIHAHQSVCDKRRSDYVDCIITAPVNIWKDFAILFGSST